MVQQYPDEAKNEANQTNKPDRENDKQSSSNSCPFMQNHRQLYLRKVRNLASIKELLVLDKKQVYQISVSNISPNVCKTCGKAIGNEGKISASTQISDFSSEITICREFATGTREAVRDSSCEAVCLAICSRRTKKNSKKTSSSEDKSGRCYCEESILSQESLPYWVVQRRQKLLEDESGHSQKYIQTQVSNFTPTDSTLHKFVCKADCCKEGVCPNAGCTCPYRVSRSETTGDFDASCACSQSTGNTALNQKVPQTQSPTVSSAACSCHECLCSTNTDQTKDFSLNVSMESSKEDKPSIDISCACANCVCSSNASVFQSKASETEAFIVEKRADNLAKGELGTLGITREFSNIECIYSNDRFDYLKSHTEEIKLHDSNDYQGTPSDYPEISDDIAEDAIGSKSKTLIGPIRNAIYPNMQTLESLDVFKAVLVKDPSDSKKAKPKAQPSTEAIAPGYRSMWVETLKEQSLIPLPARSNIMIFPSGIALYQNKSKEQQKSGKILTDTESVRQACTAALCKAVWLAIQNTDKPINLLTANQRTDICSKIQPKSDIKITEKTMEDLRKDKDKQTSKPTKIPQKAIASDLSKEKIKKNSSVSRTKLGADTGKSKLGIDSKTSRTKLGNSTKTRQSKEGFKKNDICRPTASTFNRTRTVPPASANTNKEHGKKEKSQVPSSKINSKGSGVVYKEPTKAKEKDQKGRGKVKEDMSPRDGKVCLSKPKICPAIHQNKDEFPGIIRAEVEENVTFGDIGNSFILCSVCSTMSQATSALCVAVPQKGTPIFPTRSFCDKNEGTAELQVRSPPEMRIVSEQGSPTSSKGFVCSFPAKICPIGSVSHNGSPVTLVSDTDGVAQDNESGFKMPEDLAVICSGCGFWHKLYKFPTIQEMKAFTPLQLASLCQCDSCNCKVCWNKPKSPTDKNPVIENVWPESPRSPKKPSSMDDHDCGCIASKDKHSSNSNKCDCTKCSLVAMKKEIESLRKKLTVLINGNKDTKSYKLTPSWTKINQEFTGTSKRTTVIKKPAVIDMDKKKPFVHPKATSRQSKEQNRIPSERSSRTSSLFVTNNYSLRDTRKGVASSTAAVTPRTLERSDSKPKKKATNSKTTKGVPKDWYRNSWK